MTIHMADHPLSGADQAHARTRTRRAKDAARAQREAETARKLSEQPWRANLIYVAGSNRVVGCLANAATVLRDHADMAGVLAYDEFRGTAIIIKCPPWDSGTAYAEGFTARPVSPRDELACAEWVQHQGVVCGVEVVGQAIESVAALRRWHPIREYLAGLAHDGCRRLDRWLVTYLGVEDSPYVRAVGRATLVQAIARVMRPGCQADHALVLQGQQGAGKSSAVRALAGEYFTDRLSDLSAKDAALELRGVWFVELAELDHLKRSETSTVKAYISRCTDRFRPPYGRIVQEVPRQCVFIGSTNAETFLTDETGARRFWPVTVGKIDIGQLRADRDQLLAEAYAAFLAGEQWWLSDPALVREAQEQQAARYAEDTWDEAIARFVAPLTNTTVKEIMTSCLQIPIEKQTKGDQIRVGRALAALKWTRHQKRGADDRGRRDDRVRRYFPPNEDAA
jgi:predicted P-loop ATPase